MSKMSEMNQNIEDYLILGIKIKELQEAREQIKTDHLINKVPEGTEFRLNGVLYIWTKWFSKNVKWKELYRMAVRLLNDEGQVIMGEEEDIAGTKTGPHYKWNVPKA